MDKTLQRKSVAGVKWLSINTVFNSVSTAFYHFILEILLSPIEFAYLAVITLIYRLAPLLGKFGLEEAYIQQKNINIKQTSSLVFFTVLMSCFTGVLLYINSPFIETFYQLENLTFYVRILIIAVIAEGFESIFKSSLRKSFLFKEWAVLSMLKMALRVVSTVAFISLGFGEFSIVIGIIIGSLFSLILFIIISYKKVKFKIVFYFNIKTVKKFIDFGFPVTGKRVFEIISQRADEIIIGAFLTSEILGLYFFGNNLIMQIKTEFSQTFSMVLLPLYTELKETLTSLRNTYLSITSYTALISAPVLVGISLTADMFIPLIFGEKWADSVIVVQVLSIATIIPVVTANN